MIVPVVDDLLWLALTVYQEAAGELDMGKRCVAFAIMNRVGDPRWPASVPDVIFQGWAFSAWNTGSPTRQNLDRIRSDDPAWVACYREACVAYFKLAPDPSGGANHYLNKWAVSRP